MKIKLSIKDKRIAKKSCVKIYLKYMEDMMNKLAIENKWEEKFTESIITGCPLQISDDGKVEVIKDNLFIK